MPRFVMVTSLLWTGAASLATPYIAETAGSTGVQIIRFFIGLYVGMVTPCNNLIVDNWFMSSEKGTALTIASTGLNVGTTFFALSGRIDWRQLFYVPGGLTFFLGIALLIFVRS